MSSGDNDGDKSHAELLEEIRHLRAQLAELDEIKARSEHYEAILERLADGITVQDQTGRLIYANAAAIRMIGYATLEELQSSPVEEISRRFRMLDEEGRPFPAEQLPGRRALRGEMAPQAVVRFNSAHQQEERWAAVRARPILDEQGNIPFVVNLFHDITAQKLAELALEQREQRFRALIERSMDAIALLAPDGTITYASPANQRILGIAPEEFVGQNIFAWVHPDDHASLAAFLSGLLATPGASATAMYRVRRRDDSWRWVEGTATNLIDDPNVQAIVGNYHDVSEQHHTVETLRFLARASALLSTSLDYEATLRQVASLAVPDLADWCRVDVLDEDGTIRPIAIAHSDPARVEWARPFIERYPTNPQAEGGIAQVIRTGDSVFVPYVTDAIIRAAAINEEHLDYLMGVGFRSFMVVPLVARGRVLGTIWFVSAESGRHYTENDLGLAEDVARRAAVAVDNARLYREAQEASRLRGEFLSIAAHELRTPLTTIKIYAQLLRRDLAQLSTDTGKGQLDRRTVQLGEQIDRFENLVADLLDASRIQQGRLGLRRERVDLTALALDVVARFEEAVERRSRHQLIVAAPEPVVGDWDQARLDQVLTNLLSNALKFSPSGGDIRVEVRAVGDDAEVIVSDQGVGIPEAEQRDLFQPFSRGAIGAKVEGTGLGLYITREIVEQHGGTISVWSRPGAGAVFTVRLPLRSPEQEPSAAS